MYGVDINDEAVEIAKLSLWLRTARKGRKLNSLNQNLKCGNSLIDDVSVAGDKAFNWQTEFKEVFDKGGFDVVIGNPPYVRQEYFGEFKPYFSENFKVFNFSSDLFSYFYEKGFNILKPSGVFSFISNTFDKTTAGIDLRKYLKDSVVFLKYVDFTELQIFQGATTYPVILIARNQTPHTEQKFLFTKIPSTANPRGLDIDFYDFKEVFQNHLDNKNWSFNSLAANTLIQKLNNHKAIRDIYGKCYYGIKTGLNEAFIIDDVISEKNHIRPIYEGKDLKKWNTPVTEKKLIFFKSKWTKQYYGSDIDEDTAELKLSKEFPLIFDKLKPFKDAAKKRFDKGDFWWELRNCAYYDLFEKPKIIFPNLQNTNKFSFDDEGIYLNAPAVFISTDSKALLSILNSKLVWYFLTSICVMRSGGYIEVKPQYFEQIPIPILSEEYEYLLKENGEKVIDFTKSFQANSLSFLKVLSSRLSVDINKKLDKWYELEVKDFFKELEKQKIKLSLSEQSEWLQYFEEQKSKALAIKAQIEQTDKEIDQMVYDLYELTEEEIRIVEGE